MTRVGVVGMGTMGAGIALVCARVGLDTCGIDVSDSKLANAEQDIERFLEEGIRRGKTTAEERDATLRHIRYSTDIETLADSDLVIEAASEDEELKQRLLVAIEQVVPGDAVITTNTSALSASALAATLARPARCGGLHFFNPAPLMPLVEVILAEQTAKPTVERLVGFARKIGKEPVITKDRPGFLVNRLLMPYLNQAIRAYDDGLASAQDIDTALELGLGYPIGPLKLLDIIGLDTHLHATAAAYTQSGETPFIPPPLLARLVSAGALGHKTGRGIIAQTMD